jgi:hypothetical protein
MSLRYRQRVGISSCCDDNAVPAGQVTMIRTLTRIGAAVLLALVAWFALLATEWLPRPTEAERRALAVLQAPRPMVSGPNAFATIWFLYSDLDGRDPVDAMREDVDRLHALAAAGRGDEFSSLAPDAPGMVRMRPDEFCPPVPDSCLAHVRALADHGAAVLDPHAGALRRLDALHSATHLTYPFRLEDPLQIAPYAGTMHVMRMAAARRFVDGDRLGGLAQACRDLATWRRLAPTGDLLIHGMVGIAWVDAHAHLVSEMIGEWPAQMPLPKPCDLALAAPSAVERDQCGVWRGEFRYLLATLARPFSEARKTVPDEWLPWLPSFAGDAMLNARAHAARVGVDYARGCAGHSSPGAVATDWQDWVFDPVGMSALQFDDPASNAKYRDRFADHLDLLHAVRLQAHLRGAHDLDAAVTALPADLALHDSIDVDVEDRAVTVYLRAPVGEQSDLRSFRLPPRPGP